MPHSNGFPPELAGASARIRDCLAQFQQAIADGRGVLVVAERGLDAEAVARALHARSARRGPFVVVTCAGGVQEVERALFGVTARRRGDELEGLSPASALARAHTGVLFLDDVAELPAASQRRLARVLRDGEALLHGAGGRARSADPASASSGRRTCRRSGTGARTSARSRSASSPSARRAGSSRPRRSPSWRRCRGAATSTSCAR
jgi:transcriptional regulator with AAA-type ATPase domain